MRPGAAGGKPHDVQDISVRAAAMTRRSLLLMKLTILLSGATKGAGRFDAPPTRASSIRAFCGFSQIVQLRGTAHLPAPGVPKEPRPVVGEGVRAGPHLALVVPVEPVVNRVARAPGELAGAAVENL